MNECCAMSQKAAIGGGQVAAPPAQGRLSSSSGCSRLQFWALGLWAGAKWRQSGKTRQALDTTLTKALAKTIAWCKNALLWVKAPSP